MDKKQSSLAFAALGLAGFATAIACLLFASTLGGYSFIGASFATFLTLLCATKVSALRRAAAAPDSASMPAPKQKAPSSGRRTMLPMRNEMDEDEDAKNDAKKVEADGDKDDEDAELEAQLAALRAATQLGAPSLSTPAAYRPAPEPEPTVVVTEEPLEAALAEEFAEFRAAAEPVRDATGAGAMRQMEELRAEIAQLREDARLRHAGGAARARPAASGGPDAQMRSPTLRTAKLQPTQEGDTDEFARTEFSSMDAPLREPSFARTEYQGPVELRRKGG